MIVSHKHKFIFLKTYKTASSSMEIALSAVLGPDDIITPSRPDLGKHRAIVAQNYRLEHPAVPKRPLWRKLLGRREAYYHPTVGYYEHMPAWRVKTYLGDEIWNSYFKFAFERNPWDRQVSYYYYKTRSKPEYRRPSFEQFLARSKRKALVPNFEVYTIDGEVAVDFIGRYESIEEDFEKAMQAIGLAGTITLPRANVGKKAVASYREHYNERTRQLVADWYSREIALFGYEF